MVAILIIAICVALYLVINMGKSNDASTTAGAVSAQTQNMNASGGKKVYEDYANEAIQFFDGYLSLCKNHRVIGLCHLLRTGKDEFSIKTKMECCITAIDDIHGDEEFRQIKGLWCEIGDSAIRSYFGCPNLHYAFCDADEYRFSNGQAIMAFERQFYTRGGDWMTTLKYIGEELRKRWPGIQVDVDKSGIKVEA